MIYTPRSYQRKGVEFLLSNPRAALWAQPGLGKTSTILTAIQQLHSINEVDRVLVVVPKRVLDTEVWPRELAKWDHLSGITMGTIVGSPVERIALINYAATVQVINYELLPWLMREFYETWPWDVVVHDESHKLKKYNGVWFAGKPAKKDDDGKIVSLAEPGLKEATGKTYRVWNSTGTPSPNGSMDLWSQTYLLDRGARLGPNITAFRRRWFYQGRNEHDWQPREGADRDIASRLADICMTIKAEDCFDLPELVQNVIRVEMPSTVKTIYNRMQREFFIKIETNVIEAANAAVLSGKLLQFANGFLYSNEDATEWEDLHDAKLTALQDLVEEAVRPLICCFKYKADLARICKQFPDAVRFDGKQTTVDAFNRGDIPILLMNPAGDSEGTDGLQNGTDTLVFYSLDWSLKDHDQIIERIGPTRQLQSGHPRPVFIHYLASHRTIDELVLERLIEKKTVQEILLNATRKA